MNEIYDEEQELRKAGLLIDRFLADSKGDVPLTMKMLDVVSGVLNDDHDAMIDTNLIGDICKNLIEENSLDISKYILIRMFVIKMMKFFDAIPKEE